MGNVKASKLGMLLKGALGKKPRHSQPAPEWVRLVDSGEEGAEGRRNRRRVAPEGCFSVYVGPERKRFVVRTELANHPLFRVLLDEAELEYGFCSEGPLALPCDVDLFHHVLGEMDSEATAGEMAARPAPSVPVPLARIVSAGHPASVSNKPIHIGLITR